VLPITKASQSGAVPNTEQIGLQQPFKLSEMSHWRRWTGSVFHRRGAAAPKRRSPKLLFERRTTQIAVSVDRSRRVLTSELGSKLAVVCQICRCLGQSDIGRPGRRSWRSLVDALAASGAVVESAWCGVVVTAPRAGY